MFNKTVIAAAIMFSGAAMAAESTGVAGGTITFNGSVADVTLMMQAAVLRVGMP